MDMVAERDISVLVTVRLRLSNLVVANKVLVRVKKGESMRKAAKMLRKRVAECPEDWGLPRQASCRKFVPSDFTWAVFQYNDYKLPVMTSKHWRG